MRATIVSGTDSSMPTGAEQPAPEDQRQEHHQRRQPQPAPHHARLEDIADHHVDSDKATRHHQRITQSVEQQRLNQRRNGGQYRANVGNVVKQKRQQPQIKAKRTPTAARKIQTITPVARLMMVLITR